MTTHLRSRGLLKSPEPAHLKAEGSLPLEAESSGNLVGRRDRSPEFFREKESSRSLAPRMEGLKYAHIIASARGRIGAASGNYGTRLHIPH
jgi:hypothetical protein